MIRYVTKDYGVSSSSWRYPNSWMFFFRENPTKMRMMHMLLFGFWGQPKTAVWMMKVRANFFETLEIGGYRPFLDKRIWRWRLVATLAYFIVTNRWKPKTFCWALSNNLRLGISITIWFFTSKWWSLILGLPDPNMPKYVRTVHLFGEVQALAPTFGPWNRHDSPVGPTSLQPYHVTVFGENMSIICWISWVRSLSVHSKIE